MRLEGLRLSEKRSSAENTEAPAFKYTQGGNEEERKKKKKNKNKKKT